MGGEGIEVGSWRSSVGGSGRFLLDVGFRLGVRTKRYVGCGSEGFVSVASNGAKTRNEGIEVGRGQAQAVVAGSC